MHTHEPAIDRVLTDPVESGKIPGVVALVADASGIVYQGAFGRRAIDKPEPMTLDSVFRIASMTKAVTATAAMQLIESGPHRPRPAHRRTAAVHPATCRCWKASTMPANRACGRRTAR